MKKSAVKSSGERVTSFSSVLRKWVSDRIVLYLGTLFLSEERTRRRCPFSLKYTAVDSFGI
jgi:hypothetical protein